MKRPEAKKLARLIRLKKQSGSETDPISLRSEKKYETKLVHLSESLLHNEAL
jgi:hypothetical protein